MDPVIVGEVFSAIPNLARETNRIIAETDVTAYQRVLTRVTETVLLLNQILQFDSHILNNDVRDGVNQVLMYVVNCERRLNEVVTETEPTRERFHCTTEITVDPVRGRPRYDVTQSQITSQRNIHRNWSDTARVLGISRQTLYRRRRQFQMRTDTDSNFDDISDSELDQAVRDILRISPNAGERILIGAIRGRGIRVQRDRLRMSIGRIDPISRTMRRSRAIVRRVYSVACPNEVWHIDGNHKMIRWRFVIHGAIDGYSRLITYLRCSTNNTSATVLQLFLEATRQYGIPSRVRCDMGVENRSVARHMIEVRGTDRSSVITGLSVHNQRIERLWCEVNRRVNSVFRDRFYSLEDDGLLNPMDELDMYCLHFVYLNAINEALTEFIVQYNNHPLRTANNQSPIQLWHSGTLESFWSDITGVRSILSEDNAAEHRVSERDGEVEETNDNCVRVPQTQLQLSNDQIIFLNNAVAHLSEHDKRGRYIAARNALHGLE